MARRRILIADDHVDMLERARALLASEFDVVAIVSDGQAAVDTTALLRPELAVLDISMPVMNGLDAAARMAGLPQAPRTVFLSVYDDPEFVEAARIVGGSAYVLKRTMAVDLVPAVRRALGILPPGPTKNGS
jgi:DNA-binding NarL/FixJ family response regulator